MLLLREANERDVDDVFAVAQHLDTLNLPAHRATVQQLVERSIASFAERVEPLGREYLFVAEALDSRRIIGTSMIHAQHGTRRAPHVYFDVLDEERYSQTLDRHFVHRVLQIGYNYDGPTEIGGLSVVPAWRARPEKVGRALSYVRFLYMALHRPWFRDQLLSELLPPLEPDGTSLLWEVIGRHFTGLDYREADRLSTDNKEFIRALFPHDRIHVCLFPTEVQQVIGQVGPQTKGVEKMLRRIGFTYANRIDPFDGGPHFVAQTDQVTLVQRTQQVRVADAAPLDTAPQPLLAAVDRPPGGDGAGRFRALVLHAPLVTTAGTIGLDDEARRLLDVVQGDTVTALPTA
jgi:arginine N-succinyltransferase